jgi:hypothetical protein
MQLSVKALIKPFDTSTALSDGDANEPPDGEDALSIDGGDADTNEDREGDSTDAELASDNEQDEQDGEPDDDVFDSLDPNDQQGLLEDTAAVRTMLDKVRSY